MGASGEVSEYFTEWNETFESFDQMNLHENLLRGIYAYGKRRRLRPPSTQPLSWVLACMCMRACFECRRSSWSVERSSCDAGMLAQQAATLQLHAGCWGAMERGRASSAVGGG